MDTGNGTRKGPGDHSVIPQGEKGISHFAFIAWHQDETLYCLQGFLEWNE
jgi:hypothetical protein